MKEKELLKLITSNLPRKILWMVFLSLQAVLLPHTSWLFGMFEPISVMGTLAAWTGAFSFESSNAVLVHQLAKHWEKKPKKPGRWEKIRHRWLNAYVFGLLIVTTVSSLANVAHAVQFGKQLAIFDVWNFPPVVYQLAFGAILPIVSLLFAKVLSNEADDEDAPNPLLDEAKKALSEFRSKLREASETIAALKMQLEESERQRKMAEERFVAAGELFKRLFEGEKQQRIIAFKQQWPQLTVSAIAVLAETSPGYVSETLNRLNVPVDA